MAALHTRTPLYLSLNINSHLTTLALYKAAVKSATEIAAPGSPEAFWSVLRKPPEVDIMPIHPPLEQRSKAEICPIVYPYIA